MVTSTVGFIRRPPSVMTVTVKCEHAVISQLVAQCTVADLLLSCRGSSLQPDLLPSTSPCTHTCSTPGLWWAVSYHKTKRSNQSRVRMHGRLLLPAVSGFSSHFTLWPIDFTLHGRQFSPLYQKAQGACDDLKICVRFTSAITLLMLSTLLLLL